VLLNKHMELPEEEQLALRSSQGRPMFGVELKIMDDEGNDLPHDNEAQGDLYARGHWVISGYFDAEGVAPHRDGWFPTGDVAVIDPNGFVTIKDRSKDIIKSGGEWISSVELENLAGGFEGIADAAVIAAKHAKWDERPVLIVVREPDSTLTEEDVLAMFEGKIASWQKPDAVVFVDALPRNATGKIRKTELRDLYQDYLVENDPARGDGT